MLSMLGRRWLHAILSTINEIVIEHLLELKIKALVLAFHVSSSKDVKF